MSLRILKLSLVTSLVLVMAFGLGGTAVAGGDNGKADLERVIVMFPDDVNEQAQEGLLRRFDAEELQPLSIINGWVVWLPPVSQALLKAHPSVLSLEKDGKLWPTEEELTWNIARVKADEVWPTNTGYGVKVSVIDTGIDYNHPDLATNCKPGIGYRKGVETGYMDDNGHGTHCAGIIAAVDNEIGVVGVAPEVFLYPVKVVHQYPDGYYAYVSDMIKGIEWSVENGIQVMSMSLGSNIGSRALKKACDKAYHTYGQLLVAAGGNDGNARGTGNSVDYPARYDSVIAVAATDVNDQRTSWSSTGDAVELAAPGDQIWSTYWDDIYKTKSGTSMACPHVTGTAALVWAANPGWSNVDVRVQMQNTATDLGKEGKDRWYGYGLVDAQAAAPPPPDIIPPTVVGTSPGDATDVAVTTTIEVTFSEPMNETSAEDAFSISPVVDGSISWSGETMVFTPTLNLEYETSYTYGVSTVAEDMAGNPLDRSYSWTFTTAAETIEGTMHVADIEMSWNSTTRGPNIWYKAIATVEIRDASNALVDGATVYGTWTGAYSGTVSGTTVNGTVTLESSLVKGGGTFTFTVDNVTKDGWTYDSAANVETSDSITVP